MPQSLSSVLVHLIFSTKNEPFITPQMETELYPYMATIFREQKSPTLCIGGTYDHLHVLFSLARVVTIAEIVEAIKTDTSKWIKNQGPEFSKLPLAKGLRRFLERAIGSRCCEKLHSELERTPSLRIISGGVRKTLTVFGVAYDERYVWD